MSGALTFEPSPFYLSDNAAAKVRALVEEEGLAARITRHRRNHLALVAGIEAMGLSMFVAAEHRLPSLNAIRIPDGVDDGKLRGYLLETFNLEIGGGLGAIAGPVITGWSMSLFGPNGYFLFLGVMLSAMAGYAAWRMTRRASPDIEHTGGYTPVSMATSLVAVEWAVEEDAEADGLTKDT